jgi:hypothetical protein
MDRRIRQETINQLIEDMDDVDLSKDQRITHLETIVLGLLLEAEENDKTTENVAPFPEWPEDLYSNRTGNIDAGLVELFAGLLEHLASFENWLRSESDAMSRKIHPRVQRLFDVAESYRRGVPVELEDDECTCAQGEGCNAVNGDVFGFGIGDTRDLMEFLERLFPREDR